MPVVIPSQFYWGKKNIEISTLSVGESVWLMIDNARTEFIIVNQGKPTDAYDDSCVGTWIISKNIYALGRWGNRQSYAESTAHDYLNNTFYNLIDAKQRDSIRQAKIPYRPGTSGTNVNFGANGLAVHVFLLSLFETGLSSASASVDGAKLDYFVQGSDGNSLRISTYNGTPQVWWTRSVNTTNTSNILSVYTTGASTQTTMTSTQGYRPALILSSNTLVDKDYNIV